MRLSNLFIVPLAWATMTASVPAQGNEPRFGLVIANASYAEPDSSLAASITDARQLADELRRNNFEIDLKENLGASDTRRAIDLLMSKLRNGATALLYFSGYGVQVGGKTYLIPVDAQITSEAGVRDEGISLDATLAEMQRRGAKVKIVIIDAARRNPYENRFRTYSAGLSAISGPEGVLAIYSAALGQLVSPAPSPFMHELLKELRVPARSFEDSLTAAREAVSRATNREQTPWMATTLSDSFYLVPQVPATEPPTSAAVRPSTTTTDAPVTAATPVERAAPPMEPAKPPTKTTAAERCREALARAQIGDLTDEDRTLLRECGSTR